MAACTSLVMSHGSATFIVLIFCTTDLPATLRTLYNRLRTRRMHVRQIRCSDVATVKDPFTDYVVSIPLSPGSSSLQSDEEGRPRVVLSLSSLHSTVLCGFKTQLKKMPTTTPLQIPSTIMVNRPRIKYLVPFRDMPPLNGNNGKA